MILLSYLHLKAQNHYKYCFSRDTIEIFAKSNQKRLELVDKYNISLKAIDSLKYTNNLLFIKDSINDTIISTKNTQLLLKDSVINNKNKTINKKDKVILVHRILIITAFIIGLII